MILNYWFIISFQVEVYLSNKTYWRMRGFELIPLVLIANALSGEPQPGIPQGSSKFHFLLHRTFLIQHFFAKKSQIKLFPEFN